MSFVLIFQIWALKSPSWFFWESHWIGGLSLLIQVTLYISLCFVFFSLDALIRNIFLHLFLWFSLLEFKPHGSRDPVCLAYGYIFSSWETTRHVVRGKVKWTNGSYVNHNVVKAFQKSSQSWYLRINAEWVNYFVLLFILITPLTFTQGILFLTFLPRF